MFNLFKKFFTVEEKSNEVVDVPEIIQQIRDRESESDIPLGRRIHSFQYNIFQFALDRDISKNYRVTVYQGRDRIYSFTIFANRGNYDILEEGYSKIINFINGDRRVADLPDDGVLKGFFYGH